MRVSEWRATVTLSVPSTTPARGSPFRKLGATGENVAAAPARPTTATPVSATPWVKFISPSCLFPSTDGKPCPAAWASLEEPVPHVHGPGMKEAAFPQRVEEFQ